MNPNSKKKVLAAVVTYNRLPLLKRCIQYLQNQSVEPDIIIINNSSTDGTEQFLIENDIKHITQDNLGSSGGWARAIVEAQAGNYEYLWLMDDDGFPQEQALEQLLSVINPDVACVSSVVVKENQPDEFVFGFPILNKLGHPILIGSKRKYYNLSELKKTSKTYRFAHLFNGALLNMSHVNRIGNVNSDYFMYGDEVDYFCRLRRSGEVLTDFSALHFHPDVGKRTIDDKRIYYFIRNTIILNNKYFDHAFVRNIFTVGVGLLRLFKRNGFWEALSYLFGRNAKFFYPAIFDGLSNKLYKKF